MSPLMVIALAIIVAPIIAVVLFAPDGPVRGRMRRHSADGDRRHHGEGRDWDVPRWERWHDTDV